MFARFKNLSDFVKSRTGEPIESFTISEKTFNYLLTDATVLKLYDNTFKPEVETDTILFEGIVIKKSVKIKQLENEIGKLLLELRKLKGE